MAPRDLERDQHDQRDPADPTYTRESWDDIVREHSGRVYRLAYRLTGNVADAEDLTQEVFVRVFRSLDGYVPGTFEGWLHRITTNLFLDTARRRARIRFDHLPHDPGTESAYTGHAAAPAASSDRVLLDGLFEADVEDALASLSPDFRAAVVLCDIEGLSYDEIAQVLDLKLGTVRSRIHRGRALLREALSHRAPGPGRQRVAGPADQPGPAASPGGPGALGVHG
jgi:RNA polymerase sigma-70 factor (ECF subfamily)